ncbi:hypothetical protein DDZ13_04830 [Coraliomargarita sinensis]|uniref:Uncharacterized protein n=1 Tax=Coraliomargarita sinensis TaxID=2174842 RepID=A0A317ZJU8_9BACT|nr:type II secretion system protein [Coraliomargarita sinensis]PXA04503.1 hypothetical protein DDZ13_04830 [Coraliomargarita sinensis]
MKRKQQSGFSLVETVIGVGVMALVITGGLIAIGQATLMSEKSSEQVLADFVLRSEVEALRAADWATVSSHFSTVSSYNDSNPGDSYASLLTFTEQALLDMGLEAEVTSAQLNANNETGKLGFRVLLNWEDRSGKSHAEARVLVITEGGFSADT